MATILILCAGGNRERLGAWGLWVPGQRRPIKSQIHMQLNSKLSSKNGAQYPATLHSFAQSTKHTNFQSLKLRYSLFCLILMFSAAYGAFAKRTHQAID